MRLNVILDKIKKGTFATAIHHHTVGKYIVLSKHKVFKKQSFLLSRMLKYAVKNVPYYRGLNISGKINIEDFPVISKQQITALEEQFISVKKNKYAYSHGCTGGSTGEPFAFLSSGDYEQEFNEKKWQLYGYKKNDLIVAMDGTKLEPEKIKDNIYGMKTGKPDMPFGSYALSSLYLTKENAIYYYDFLNKIKPAFLRGYPSFIYELATIFEDNGWHIDFVLKGIELTSETIEEYQIKKIESLFNTRVYLQYGHSEACAFGYSIDKTFRYQIEPLYGYIEILKDNGNHANVGEIGEIVVTSLHNYVMPLIRYRTGDYAVFGGRDDKYIFLDRVLGRTQDYIFDSEGNRILLTALIFGQHSPAMKNIVKWQIEQETRGLIVVHIIKGKNYTDQDERQLKEQFLTLGKVNCIFDYVDNIGLTPRGKSKMLVQHINCNE